MATSIITMSTTSAATSLITGPTWAPESAADVFTATSLSGTSLPNTTCPGPASPTHGTWISPDNSITLEPLNQTTLDYALTCCKNAGIYYFIDPQCSDQVSGSGLFCQPVGQTLAQLDLCFKNGTEPVNGIGSLYCTGDDGQCSHTAPTRSASAGISATAAGASGSVTTTPNAASGTTSGSTTVISSTESGSAPTVSKAAAPPVLVPHGDGPAGVSKVVVAFGVIWLVGMFAGGVAM